MKRSGRRGFLEQLEWRQLLDGDGLASWSELSDVAELAEAEGLQVPDFSLQDVNPASATFNRAVSPRDYVGQVSAWYFGHAS